MGQESFYTLLENGTICGECISEAAVDIEEQDPVLWQDFTIASGTSNSLFIWIKLCVDQCVHDDNLTGDYFKNLMEGKIKEEIGEISDSDLEGYASDIWDKIQDKCKA